LNSLYLIEIVKVDFLTPHQSSNGSLTTTWARREIIGLATILQVD
jgi:hypothetical protein